MAKSAGSILYCHCTYANVVPAEVKQEVLRRLVASGKPFDAVADLCELSATKHPSLQALAERKGLRIAACFPRAVRGLFAAAGAPLPVKGPEILNMRRQAAHEIAEQLLGPDDRGEGGDP